MLHRVSLIHFILALCFVLASSDVFSLEVPSSDTAQPAASDTTAEDEKELLKIPSVMLYGRFDLAETKEGEEKQTNGNIGVLVTKTESVQLKAKNDAILNDLKEKAGKLVTVEGKMRETNGQAYLLVTRVVIKVQPPSGFRNPRGL